MKKTMFPREFVEWLIHNTTMEATTYSPMLYLKWQSKDEVDKHDGHIFNFTKEWHNEYDILSRNIRRQMGTNPKGRCVMGI
jgi:hypothetical protein